MKRRIDYASMGFWEKRRVLESNPDLVWEILEEGNKRARKDAQKTIDEVRAALGF